MRLINTEIGRVIRLIPMEEIRPLGGLHLPTALRMVSEQYGFSHTPDLLRNWEETQKDGLKFQLGKLVHGNRTINVIDFTLYNDGIVATSVSTDDAELFLDDLMAWGKEVFGLREIDRTNVRTLYLSNVIVEFESSPDSLLKSFTILSESLAELLRTTYGLDLPVQLYGLGLHFDRTITVPAWQTITQFTLDRRINQPYSKNRFYSGAPLKTKDHLAFLEIIESTLNVDRRPSQRKGKKASEILTSTGDGD